MGITSALQKYSTAVNGTDMKAAIASIVGGPFLLLVSSITGGSGVVAGAGRAVFGGFSRAAVSVLASGGKWFPDASAALVSVVSPDEPDAPVRVAVVTKPEHAVWSNAAGKLGFGSGRGDLGVSPSMDVYSCYPAGDYSAGSAGGNVLVGRALNGRTFTPAVFELWTLTIA
jgi:hypothetical protein